MCVSFFSFFFFKQKTAYEMRISDWSSDVCSSDLAERPGRHAHAERGNDRLGRCCAQPLAPTLRVVADPATFCVANGVPGGPQAVAGRKIGRAACRERVCQYV